ncbi:MAG: sugar ABC transporter permease [Sideroxydans sp.]|nr:sugar ABC transporter permease [Sideroxydans sp.]
MKLPAYLQRTAFWGLGISLLITLALSAWLFRAGVNELQLQQRHRIAVMHANALSLAISSTDVEETAKRVREIQKFDPGIESLIVVKGTQLVASTNAADSAPRQLKRDEKPLYDLSNLLRTARETNRGEGVVRNKTIRVEENKPGHIQVSLPYLLNGEFAGIVQMRFNLLQPAMNIRLEDSGALPILIFFGALLVGGFLKPNSERRMDPAKLMAIAAFLLSALFYQQQRLDRLEQVWVNGNRVVAANYLETAEQYDRAGYLPLVRDPASANLWDTDHYQRPLELIAADGSSTDTEYGAKAADRTSFIKPILWAIDILGIGILLLIIFGYAERMYAAFKQHIYAYVYIAPAMIGMFVLVFFPFAYGIALAFTDTTLFNESLPFQERLIGLANFKAILGDFNLYERTADGIIWNYANFYWTLFITVLWTVSNVFIGVTVGFLLAMALNTEGLRGKAIYRVLLILPWAIPNYITALVWRGMFHPQFGVINQVLQMFGLEPVKWFDGVVSSFITGVATNGWLSFPFMMVVILGALQSIPRDMYEAAEVEGANRWQRLRFITLPLLKPTLIPAIVLSVVWTFNMFNIIFLVSGGEPAGANEILVTKAYKLAFENYQYAYAAAYSTVIFIILLAYGVFQTRVSKATESF